MTYEQFCYDEYKKIFLREFDASRIKNIEEKRRVAQKIAIKETSINAIRKFPTVEPFLIWNTIYIAHVNKFTGITDQKLIDNIISADNSWKKSSGHAFEEMIKQIGNIHLVNHGLKILLQRELSLELKENNVLNEVRDISWLKEQVASDIFDLFLTIENNNKYIVYGCVQSKTSIRDRVTRDREPSINAMKAFFLSIAIVMNGDFLRLPKFQHMVNGGSTEFQMNGWHSMYVLTHEKIENDRIKPIDINMDRLIDDCVKGADFWKTQRQWLNNEWRP